MDTTEHDKVIAAALYNFRMMGKQKDSNGRIIQCTVDDSNRICAEYYAAIKAKEDAIKEYKATHKGSRKEILSQITALLALLEDAD